ncbi:membrane protein [Amycolatopsis ultiminotia]|uniref:Membrane protein n=1 Tax=Amycolatopsis ultiminotia TaxID=543629 RepID=A0ABP6XT48_9PSEU
MPAPLPGPDTRIVELRVAGLVGTSGETLLDAVTTVDVAGDGLGRVVRPADRLRRPAPGPVVPALGRSIPRTLEGYLWTGMTSGGAAKAVWALLFPFSLANVAFWMLPPVHRARWLGGLCRGLLRVAALLLTMLLVSQISAMVVDLVASQCLAPGRACLPWVPSWLREEPVRIGIGVALLLGLTYVLHRISSTNWRVRGGDRGDRKGAPLQLRADPGAPGMAVLHTVAALACIALPLLGGPATIPVELPRLITWICALALVLAAVVGAAIGSDSGRIARRSLVAFATLVVIASAVLVVPGDRLPGIDATVEGLGGALVVVTALFALALVPSALLARSTWRDRPRRLRPWLGGWAAAPVLALAGLLGGGFGAGLGFAVRRLLGADGLKLPMTYDLVTALWGGGLALMVLIAVAGYAIGVPLRKRRRGVPPIVELMEPDRCEEQDVARAWARSAWERRHLHQLTTIVALGLCVGAVTLLVVRFGFGLQPPWFGPVSAVGVFALGGLAAGLLRVVYSAARSPERSRHLGALSDLVSFWPRAAHPGVPPCYALKVVPELADRVKEHLAEPGTRVVLSGLNLGSVLTVLTAARLCAELPDSELDRVGLLTAGSPLQWGYQRAFPAVLPQESLAELFGKLDGRWRALCRGTDIFGGGVTTWRHQTSGRHLLGDGYLPEGGSGPLETTPEESGALVLGGDHWLPDPLREPDGRRRWAPGVLKHTEYLADPEWDNAVAMAAGLGRTGRARALGEQGALFSDLPRPR